MAELEHRDEVKIRKVRSSAKEMPSCETAQFVGEPAQKAAGSRPVNDKSGTDNTWRPGLNGLRACLTGTDLKQFNLRRLALKSLIII